MSQAAIPAHTAPAATPARITRGSSTTRGRSDSVMPTATAPVAPRIIWPSPPMLNLPAARGITNASARSVSGTHFLSVCTMPVGFRNELVSTARNARNGSWPSSTMMTATTANAASTASTYGHGRDQRRAGPLGHRRTRGDGRRVSTVVLMHATPVIRRPARRGRSSRGDVADEATRVDHLDPVGEGDDLVEVLRDDDDDAAGGRGRADPLVDERRRRDVQAAGGVVQQQHLRLVREGAGQDDALDVAARQLPARGRRARRLDAELVDGAHRLGPRLRPVDEAAGGPSSAASRARGSR